MQEVKEYGAALLLLNALGMVGWFASPLFMLGANVVFVLLLFLGEVFDL
jgi:uncharacterized membrane protein